MSRAAWVITWEWIGDNHNVCPNPLYILNPHWSADRVLSVMQAIYLNAGIHFIHERPRFFKSLRKWPCIMSREGPRIILGDNPILVASYVHDLELKYDAATDTEIATWTQPAGVRVDDTSIELKFEQLGNPTPMIWKKKRRSVQATQIAG